ncbi:Propionyl-CoA carboxylase alpha chain, partial [Gonioctena quinquepunctata]
IQLKVHEKHKLLSIASALFASNRLRSRNFVNSAKHKIYGKTLDSWDLYIEILDEKYKLKVLQSDRHFIVKISGEEFRIDKSDLNLALPLLEVKVNDERNIVQVLSKNASGYYHIIYRGTIFKLYILSQRSADYLHLMPEKIKFDISKQVRSPMPGLVKSVACNVGDEVAEGQELCIIEAMKMQNSMVAQTSGKIRCINIHPGDTVGDDDVLIELA